MLASGFCAENFANLKRHNKLPLRSSSSLSQFPFICHFIICSQTFACTSAPPLNVTAVFVHLQIIVWVIIKDSGNLFSGGIGIQLRPILCSVDVLLQQQHEKMIWWRLPACAHLIMFISFPKQHQIQKLRMSGVQCFKMAIGGP